MYAVCAAQEAFERHGFRCGEGSKYGADLLLYPGKNLSI